MPRSALQIESPGPTSVCTDGSSITTPAWSSTSRTTSNSISLVFVPQKLVVTVSPTAALEALGVTLNVNVTSGGASGPVHVAATMSSLIASCWPAPATVTVFMRSWSLTGPSITSVAVVDAPAGTSLESNCTPSVSPMISTDDPPLLLTTHVTVVCPVSGSHAALAESETDGASVVSTPAVVCAVVVGGEPVAAGVNVVGGATVVGANVVDCCDEAGEAVATANPDTDNTTNPAPRTTNSGWRWFSAIGGSSELSRSSSGAGRRKPSNSAGAAFVPSSLRSSGVELSTVVDDPRSVAGGPGRGGASVRCQGSTSARRTSVRSSASTSCERSTAVGSRRSADLDARAARD